MTVVKRCTAMCCDARVEQRWSTMLSTHIEELLQDLVEVKTAVVNDGCTSMNSEAETVRIVVGTISQVVDFWCCVFRNKSQ